jgi:pyruvate/2-oxoglutarate dehydrogenase complex dihydrolipoamide dehydrogenase (E3) component
LPSKNIIHSAKVVDYFRRSEEFGISHDGFAIDMAAVRERKRKMVRGLNDMYMENYRNTGAEFILGTGRFLAPRIVEVTLADGTTRQLRGANVIVSTGTRAALEAIPGLAEAQPLTHIEALELDEIPEHLIVVGGGYVGVELSQAIRRFGSKVTVIDRNGRLMSREDPDVCDAVRSLLADDLELTGVELTDRGYIKVNERLQTTAPGVWAIGEVAGSPQFTHISVDDFRVVHANLTGGNRVTTGRQVPYCLFTDPELARIGPSETEAQAQGIPYRLLKVPMETNLRARTLSETSGFVKALVETDSDRILGFTAFGVGAGEILAAVQIAMTAGLPYTTLRDAVLTHPTLVEGLIALFSSAASAHNVVEMRGAQTSAA